MDVQLAGTRGICWAGSAVQETTGNKNCLPLPLAPISAEDAFNCSVGAVVYPLAASAHYPRRCVESSSLVCAL